MANQRTTKPEGINGALPRLRQPMRVVINDPSFPVSMHTKDEYGRIAESKIASKNLYKISQNISDHIRFLPVECVDLTIEHHDKVKLKDYTAFVDVCLRTLYRACVIEDLTSATIKSMKIKHIPADKRKIVIQLDPAEQEQEPTGSVS